MKPPFLLESANLLLRKLQKSDAREIFENYASHSEILNFVSWKPHKKIEDTVEFLTYAEAAWERGTDYSYSIRLSSDQQLIGSIGMINESGRVSLGYIIAKPFWNRGYATEAVKTVINWLRTQPEVFRIWAVVDTDNQASSRVLLKTGMKKEALVKNWIRFVNQGQKVKDCYFYLLDS